MADFAAEIVDPELPIIDIHHHLDAGPDSHFALSDLLGDLASGHNVVATGYCENKAFYRSDGPQAYRSVGEVEFVNGAAAIGASGQLTPTRICAVITGYADLALGSDVDPVLERLIAAGNGRLRGVRTVAGNDPEVKQYVPPGLLADPALAEGFGRLAAHGLLWETWLYHTQLLELLPLLEAHPDVPVVINHVGGLIGIGSYAARREAEFATWRSRLAILAEHPQVHVKIGGIYMPMFGLLNGQDSSAPALARAGKPVVEAVVEVFGPQRCMFESNFPLTRDFLTYRTLWNAYKLLTGSWTATERQFVFHDTAQRLYRVPV
jgi:predicted TIM-barrel fold metal-dependent hydrolase